MKTKPIIVEHEYLGKCEYYPDKIPCPHPGCQSHISHPCEYCLRKACKGEAFVQIINK